MTESTAFDSTAVPDGPASGAAAERPRTPSSAGGIVIEPSSEFEARAAVSGRADYQAAYDRSIADPEGFWSEIGRDYLSWITPFTKVADGGFENLDYTWFADGTLQRRLSTASTGTWAPGVGRRRPSSGRATTARRARSPTSNSTMRCAGSQTCSARRASAKATASRSTCRWSRSSRSPCSRARASARRIRSSSAGSPPAR